VLNIGDFIIAAWNGLATAAGFPMSTLPDAGSPSGSDGSDDQSSASDPLGLVALGAEIDDALPTGTELLIGAVFVIIVVVLVMQLIKQVEVL